MGDDLAVDQARLAWQEFRAARESELAATHGWLCLTGFHWLPDAPGPVPGLPGLWWAREGVGFVEADASDGLQVNGTLLVGRSEQTVAALRRVDWLDHAGTRVELLNRDGRLAIRMRAETSSDRESFEGVPVWDYDPAWVLEGRFQAYPEARQIEVATIRPDLRQRVPALGEVGFTIGGRPQRLVATTIKSGLSVEFHDPTNGAETPTWRQLKFTADENGCAVLDFNRTIDMWFAFTDYATCPSPVGGNTITVPVRAGEKTPYLRG